MTQRILFLVAVGAAAVLATGCEPDPVTPGSTGSGTGGEDALVGSDTPGKGDATKNETTQTDVGKPCIAGDACNTGDACSVGVCSNDGFCIETPAGDGTPCEDGQECTQGDVCKGGVCEGGPTPPDCTEPCLSNDECKPGQYCAAKGCDMEGDCTIMPDGCPENYAPTCGCDSQTYGNACEAAAAGVNVASQGPCDCASVSCSEGTEAVDSNGDGCPDTCLAPCKDACNCYDVDAIGFEEPCPLKCATCDNYWTCDQGY